MAKHMSISKMLNRKDCYGWAWHVKGRQFAWQNANDLGLFSMECDDEPLETLLRKVPVAKGKYIYILRNNWNITEEDVIGATATLTGLKAVMKDCYNLNMTSHEKMLSNRYLSNVI